MEITEMNATDFHSPVMMESGRMAAQVRVSVRLPYRKTADELGESTGSPLGLGNVVDLPIVTFAT